ncbi:MAG: hypothetical protein P1U41_03615 [Vicingaceae bacterium]|nr:hypothetical protein [Vicingaceae bacterium]
MRKLKGLLTIGLVIFCVFSANAQSLSELSDSELESKKTEAIAAENYELANQIKAEQNARKSIDDKLKEKNEELKTAIANEDFEKAELLKKEIAELEANKAKLIELEEDRKIAVFEERYDDVIAIEKKMSAIRKFQQLDLDPNNPESIEALTKLALEMQNNNNASTSSSNNKGSYFKPVAPGASNYSSKSKQKELLKQKTASHKQDLIDKPYNEKIIGTFNMGFKSGTYRDEYSPGFYYEYDYTVFAYHVSNSRWWLNKYLAGGTFFNFGFPEEGTLDGGAHLTGFADFDSQILPYAAFGFGMGIDMESGEFYTPIILRIGSNFFFNKHRSFGLSAEYNQYFNNEFMPKFRLGLVWTRMKRKHNTWIQNKK